MAHRPDTQRGLPVKTKLILIAIVFVVVTLVFEYGFDSSEESENSVELDNTNQLTNEKRTELEEEMEILINP